MARILIIENDDFVIKQIKDALRRFGHGFVTVRDGKTARARLQTGIFDLALVDNYIPGARGTQLLQEQKTLHVEDRIPAILMTAQHDASVIREAREAGAVDFISKPFNPRELVAKVMAVLKQETRITCLGGGSGLYTLLMGLKMSS